MKNRWVFGLLLFAVHAFAEPGAFPKSYDWRQVLGGLTPVKNEKQCGAPYALAATAAFETAILMKEGARVSLSDQELVSCDTQNSGCNGGFTSLPYLVEHGIALDSSFPYQGTDLQCPTGLPVFRKADGWGTLPNADGSDAPTNDAIKAAILRYGAVISQVDVTESFTEYTGGIYDTCDGTGEINHLVNLVGWNDEGEYWIARNVWGENWGEKGYINVKWGCNSIAKVVSYIVYDERK